MTWLLGGLVLGLASSVHCASMCGPILVVARHWTPATVLRSHTAFTLYHGARISAYAVFGAIAGAVGSGLLLAPVGRAASAVGGAVLLIGAVVAFAGACGWRAGFSRWTRRSFAGRFAAAIGNGLRRAHAAAVYAPRRSLVVAGVLNAGLPCGLLYAALTVSAVLARPGSAAAFMALYGVGTMPLLGVVHGLAGVAVVRPFRSLRLLSPLIVALVALLLIARGLAPASTTAHAHGEGPLSSVNGHLTTNDQ